jgi:hypothetical protein
MNNLEYLRSIFDKLDEDHDDFIDKLAFKKIINILDMPIYNINKDYYDFDDLLVYIKNNFKNTNKKSTANIKIKQIKEKLKESFDELTIDFIILDTYGNICHEKSVKIDKIFKNDSIVEKNEKN